MLNAFTVDVEDYFQVTAFERRVPRERWDEYPSRVVANTRRILQLLDRRQVSATFFVLGWVAERFAALIREIAAAGHEVGCHSYWHRLLYDMTPDEFRTDLKLARDAIERAVGRPVVAYRAPSFSITRKTLWALEILADEGFRCDSSIFPVYHDRYGIPDAPLGPHRRSTPRGALWEFPPSACRVYGVNLPVSGGGYFRLYPARWTARWLRQINESGRPFTFYVHPWELDPDQPRLAGPALTRWRHSVNLSSTEEKLDWLLGQFSFGRMSDALQDNALDHATASDHWLVTK
jgi:polysaccharide deacetylase family protein (PEP-CTERM system associated)